MNPIDLVLSRVDRASQVGERQWSARCPAHPDRDPSLSVSVGDDGRILLCCHAGCAADAICAAIGLRVGDLFPKGSTPPKGPASGAKKRTSFASIEEAICVATTFVQRERGPDWTLVQSYPYENTIGREVLRVLRFEPAVRTGDKTYRPVGAVAGGWRVGDPEGLLPLYRVTTLASAATVFVTEGEKAADAAVELGFTATTNAHGAQAAKRTDWSPLRGKDVVLLRDNDDPGLAWAAEVASILVKLGATVRTVLLPGLPEHGDIVEFVAARRAAGLDVSAILSEVEQIAAATASVGSGGASGKGSGESNPPSDGSVGAPPRAVPEFGEPEPLPNDLPPVDKFNTWMLPRALCGWITDIAERIQCPIDFPAVTAMVALASVLGRKVGIRPKQCDDWLVVANLWGALIGRSGIMKTPPLQEATRPLKRLEIEAKKAFEAALERFDAEEMVFEAKKKAVQGDIRRNLKSNDDDGALAAAQTTIESEPKGPVRRRYVVNDSTVEKLGEILNENPNGVLGLRDELAGLLRNLDKEGQESARAFYLEAWNGTGRFTYDRIGRGTVDIEAAIVSILGSIQPGPLARYLREALEGGHGDDGLMSRFQLAVWPDPTPEWKNVDRNPDTEAKNTAYGVFAWFDGLTPEDVKAEQGLDGEDIPFLRFHPRAQRVFDRWRGGLERRLRSDEEHPALESHFAKYRSLIPALALLIHLADGGTGQVGLEPLRKAIAWGRYLSSHARRIYAVVAADDVAAAKRLVARIRKGGVKDKFTERDVYHKDWSGLDRDSVRKAVKVLVEYGWLIPQEERTEGRSKTIYRINPRIRERVHGGTVKADRSGDESAGGSPEDTDTTDRSPAGQPVSAEEHPGSADGTDRRSGGEWGGV